MRSSWFERILFIPVIASVNVCIINSKYFVIFASRLLNFEPKSPSFVSSCVKRPSVYSLSDCAVVSIFVSSWLKRELIFSSKRFSTLSIFASRRVSTFSIFAPRRLSTLSIFVMSRFSMLSTFISRSAIFVPSRCSGAEIFSLRISRARCCSVIVFFPVVLSPF
jgi:hypothetical protein